METDRIEQALWAYLATWYIDIDGNTSDADVRTLAESLAELMKNPVCEYCGATVTNGEHRTTDQHQAALRARAAA